MKNKSLIRSHISEVNVMLRTPEVVAHIRGNTTKLADAAALYDDTIAVDVRLSCDIPTTP